MGGGNEDTRSEASSTTDGGHDQTFRILGNSEELGAVLSQAGEVSRIASDRLLNERGRSDEEVTVEEEGVEMQAMTRLTSESTISPLFRPIGDGALRQPKAARDPVCRALFVVHVGVALCAPGAYMAPRKALGVWLPTGAGLRVVSPTCATATAALFAACLLISEPREVRVAVATLAYPLSLFGAGALAAVAAVEAWSGHDLVVVGVWGLVPLVSAIRAVASAHQLRGTEPFFDAMLELVARFFETSRAPLFKLVYGALAFQGAHLVAWSSARAAIRGRHCAATHEGAGAATAYVAVELALVASLYWTTQVVRCLVRAVVSGCAMHYLVRLAAERPHDEEDEEEDDLLLADEAYKARPGYPRKPRPVGGGRDAADDARVRARRKELVAAARKAEAFFIRLSLTTSFGSVCRGALVCPVAEALRGILDLCAATRLTRCLARPCLRRDAALARFARTDRDLAFVHVAMLNKAFAAAAHDVASVVDESGVADLLAADTVVPLLQTFRAALGALFAALFSALTLLSRHAAPNTAIDCQDANSLLLHFGFAFIAVALAVEPVVAAAETFYLAFAQAPHGLTQADPIVYRRFVRLLNRDAAAARPQRDRHRLRRNEISL